jgi:gamma-glutamyl:cysteine ligase YbdK (ATP-grasp superfamily)
MGGEGVALSQGAPMGSEIRQALDRLRDAIGESSSNKAATNAMANLAEAIQGLVQHMRSEQQMLRDWVEAQADQQKEVRRLLQVLAREQAHGR